MQCKECPDGNSCWYYRLNQCDNCAHNRKYQQLLQEIEILTQEIKLLKIDVDALLANTKNAAENGG